MVRRTGIMWRMTQQMHLGPEGIPGLPLAEIAGEHRVLIENHKGVVKYTCDEIMVCVSFGYFRICGDNLKLLQMTDVRLVIGGCIYSLQLVKKDKI